MITANDLGENALERFDDGVDNNNGVNVTFNDAVDAQAYNAASGVTTSGPSIDFTNFVLCAKQTLQDSASSVNLPITFYVFPEYWAWMRLFQFLLHEYFTERVQCLGLPHIDS
jgi:hypothetical protein